MEKELLLELLKNEQNDIDAIGMILSNYTDFGSSEGGMVSVKQFNKVAECLIEWWKNKTMGTKLTRQWLSKEGYSNKCDDATGLYKYQKEDVVIYEHLSGFKYSDGTELDTVEDLQKCIVNEFGDQD